MKHVEERFGPEASKEVLLMCIGITSGVGRLIFGRAADYINGVNKVYLQVSARPPGFKGADFRWRLIAHWFNQYGKAVPLKPLTAALSHQFKLIF